MSINSSTTNVYFDYGGCYSQTEEEIKWISRGPLYAVSFKTSMEEITYPMLADRICRKIAIDETTTKLKMSYIPLVVKPQSQSYLFDDEDVYVFLTTIDKELLRSVLHVELIKDLEINQQGGQSSFGVNYGEMLSSGRANDVDAAGIFTIDRADEENVVIEDGEKFELPGPVEESQIVEEWEDGTSLEIGQEFSSKEAVYDLVDRASCLKSFGISIVKSDTKRIVLQCSQAKEGCRWYVRLAKVKKSDNYSVRVYRKMHRCSRAAASTSTSKRKHTPRLVASILQEEFQGKFDAVAPKNLISIVQERLGMQVSYSTALRGKRKAVNDMRNHSEQEQA